MIYEPSPYTFPDQIHEFFIPIPLSENIERRQTDAQPTVEQLLEQQRQAKRTTQPLRLANYSSPICHTPCIVSPHLPYPLYPLCFRPCVTAQSRLPPPPMFPPICHPPPPSPIDHSPSQPLSPATPPARPADRRARVAPPTKVQRVGAHPLGSARRAEGALGGVARAHRTRRKAQPRERAQTRRRGGSALPLPLQPSTPRPSPPLLPPPLPFPYSPF